MPKPQSLADWLALLETRHPVAIELGLERVAEVARRLQLARPAPRVVTVAGTNGKGSCVALLEALLQHAGMSVGTYTSPHLLAYNERVRIAGRPVSDAALCAAFARIEEARGDIRLTYFEVGTLAALLLFAEAGVEVAVLEVGMGGRLDAVNIVAPDVAVITSIALDHQAWLGADRDRIGVEKAGIARPGVVTVCGDPDPPPAMCAALAAVGSPTLFLRDDGCSLPDDGFFHGKDGFSLRDDGCFRGNDGFVLHEDASGLALTCIETGGAVRRYPGLPVPQLPRASAACAVQALVSLGMAPTPAAVAAAFAETRLPGRFQRVRWQGRELILDVAHNPAATALLARQLSALGRPAAEVHGVVGALADKDLPAMFAPLTAAIGQWHCCELPGVARAAPAARLAAVLYNDIKAVVPSGAAGCHPDPAAGLAAALHASHVGDLILVFGSFHTLAPVLALLAATDHAEAGEGEIQ